MSKKCKISDIVLPEGAAKELEAYLKKNFVVDIKYESLEDKRLINVLVHKKGDEYTGSEKKVDMKSIILKALDINLT